VLESYGFGSDLGNVRSARVMTLPLALPSQKIAVYSRQTAVINRSIVRFMAHVTAACISPECRVGTGRVYVRGRQETAPWRLF
jgi:hypothetical protein